ncbi:Protein laz1 [Ranunculus cassubicifolius]
MKMTVYPHLITLGNSSPSWAISVAGILVLITITLSAYLIFEHLSAYKNPEEQKFLVCVILMVPCYSVESFISLAQPSISVYFEILRDCYEAFAMYSFGRYLVACLGREERTIEFMRKEGRINAKTPLLHRSSDKGIVKHHFPMNCFLKPWKLGQWFYQVVKFGIVQYMIIKSLSAIFAVIFEALGVYCEGEFSWNCGYPYIAVILNFSQSWALYCLVQFYTVTKDELEHIKPLAKFLTFKSIVFLTWWQGLALALIFYLGLFKSHIPEFQSSLQSFIICIEMAVASTVHLFVFPAKPCELLGDRFSGSVSVLGDYSADCPLDPDEIRDSKPPTKLRLPQNDDVDIKIGGMAALGENVKDVVFGGDGYIVEDVRFTVTTAVDPMEKGFTRFNERLQKISENIKRHDKKKIKEQSITPRVIRGIDDPLLHGSISDSGVSRLKKHHHRRKSGYASADSGGESSNDQSYGGYQIGGNRWVSKV